MASKKFNNVYIKDNVYVPITEDERNNLKINYVLTKNKKPMDGEVVGKAEIFLKEKIIHTEDIYIKVPKEKEKLSWWQKIIRWFKSW